MSEPLDPLIKWRLILGEAAEESLGGSGLSERWLDADGALDWLYGREDPARPDRRAPRRGGKGRSGLTVPEWINEVDRLFPKSTRERLERDALQRYELTEIVTDLEALQRAEPSPTLLKAVLQTKQLMNPEVLAVARKLVAKVVAELMAQLQVTVRRAFSGVPDRRTRSPLPSSRNFDAKRTLRDNLKHTDPETGRLIVRRPYFVSRTRVQRTQWKLVLVVDQSGSMLDSTIHAAVTAACFWRLPSVRTHLLAFDTEVVDLTRDVDDPVELLMRVQLGGGTDIGRAMEVARSLVDTPRKTIVVLITDFFEGGDPSRLVGSVRAMCQQGTTVLGLAALDSEANPFYDEKMAKRLAEEGAHIGAMTPDQLAGFLVEVMHR